MRIIIISAIFIQSLIGDVFNFESISSKFTQTITNDLNSTITYKGSFYAKNNKKALWIYNEPIEKKIYFNNNEVLIIEPDLEQVILTTLQNTPNISQILRDAKQTSPNIFTASFDDIKYDIHLKNKTIDEIHYKDKLGNSVLLKFDELSYDTFLDDILFQPSIPKDYDIIHQ